MIHSVARLILLTSLIFLFAGCTASPTVVPTIALPTVTIPPPTTSIAPSLTPTSTPSATDTPTPTPTATATRTPTATPTPIPLKASLVARHPSLVLMASKLGLPAQVLNGTISGGSTPYSVVIHIVRPDGSGITYALASGTSFSFGKLQAGDPDFGTTQQGTWRACSRAGKTLFRVRR